MENSRKFVLEKLERLKVLNLDGFFGDTENKIDPSDVIVGQDLTYGAFLRYYYRMVDELEALMEDQDSILLPHLPTHGMNQQQIQSSAVIAHLNSLHDRTEKKNWKGAIGPLLWLVRYLMSNGYWNRSELKVHEVDEVKLKDQQKKLALQEKEIETLKKEIEEEKAELVTKLKEFGQYIGEAEERFESINENSKAELANIESEKVSAAAKTQEIQGFRNNSAALFAELNANLQNSQATIAEDKEKRKKEEFEFERFRGAVISLEEESLENQKRTREEYEKANVLREEIEGRKEEINRLLGLTSDAALSAWFKDRQQLLRKSLKFWMWVVPVIAILAIGWAIGVFAFLGTPTDNQYVNLGVNALKTVPAFILLGFAMRQYRRERLVEEEYAFRSAISNTIHIYSELLESKDSEDNKSRNEMLREALKQIYAMPKLYKEKTLNPLRFRTSDFPALVKEISETLEKAKKISS